MTEAIAVPTQGFTVPPAAPGTVQHSREYAAPAPAPAEVPPVQGTQPAAPAQQPTQPQAPIPQDQFLHSQPIVPALDPRLTELLRQEAARKDPVADQPVEKPDIVKPQEQQRPQGGLNDIDVAQIDDPQLRTLGELLITSAPNLDLERALGKAIEYLDPNLIDTHYIKEVGGEKAKALVALAEQIVNTAAVQGEATINAIYQGAGGKENWDAAVALFNKQAPQHIRQVAAELLDSKNFERIKTGAQFILDYARQQGGLATQPQYQQPSAARGDAAQALTKAQFQQELQKLVPEHLNPQYAEQRAELYRRRQLGKDLGVN